MKHKLYKTGDQGIPDGIKDRNGEVVLDMCKVCSKAESELDQPCKTTRQIALEWWNTITFEEKWYNVVKNKTSITGYPHRNVDTLSVREIELLYNNKV